MINKLTVGGLFLALTVSVSPIPATADALRSLSVENPQTRVGLEESLLGRKLRSTGRRLANYLVLAGLMFQVAQGPSLPVPQAAGPPPAAAPSPALLPNATVTPTTLTVEFPPALAGRLAGAYLFTDTGYLQAPQPIPVNGVVTFAVEVSPPNKPGWLAAGDRVVAVFPSGVAPPTTSRTAAIPGATLVARVAPDGTLRVLVGQWPPVPSFRPGMGAMAPLRQFLGPQRQVGVIVEGDPAQILTLIRAGNDFFGELVRAGHDTIWISGLKFTQISPEARQEFVIRAANAGLTTLGFLDGDFSWAEAATWPAVARLYQDQFDALRALDLGPLTVQWKTDVEQQDAARLAAGLPPWDGGMASVMDLTEQIIVPGVRQFERDYRARHPMVTRAIVRSPAVWQFGATWLYNGGRPNPTPSIAPGAVVHGIRPLAGTGVAGATFQNTVEGIDAVGQPVYRRAAQENAPFLYVVEAAQRTDGRTFDNRVADIAPIVLGAAQRVPLDQFPLLDGVAWHAADANGALNGAQQILAAHILAVSPGGRSWARRAAVSGQTRFQIWYDTTQAGELILPAAFATARLLPQFGGENYDYLFVKAAAGGGDAYAVFGARRPLPGSGTVTPTWKALPLRDAQGTRITFLDRDPADPSGQPIFMPEILPNFPNLSPPKKNNDLKIRYSPVNDPSVLRTMILTIEIPSGLEEVGQWAVQQAADAIRVEFARQGLSMTEHGENFTQSFLPYFPHAREYEVHGSLGDFTVTISGREGGAFLHIMVSRPVEMPLPGQAKRVITDVLRRLHGERVEAPGDWSVGAGIETQSVEAVFDPEMVRQRQALIEAIDPVVDGVKAFAEAAPDGPPLSLLVDSSVADAAIGDVALVTAGLRQICRYRRYPQVVVVAPAGADGLLEVQAGGFPVLRVAAAEAPPALGTAVPTVFLQGLDGRKLPTAIFSVVITDVLGQWYRAGRPESLTVSAAPYLPYLTAEPSHQLMDDDVLQLLLERFA